MGRLNTFPLSFKVQGRRIVIIGGGEEALNKARLAVKTTAQVVIIARELEADFSALPVDLMLRPFVPADLDNAALVFVADDGPDGEAAQAAARARNIPLNVVDVPRLCDFYTPAMIDRAPLTIAISSEGEAPVLARLVRARIEAILSPQLGQLARLAGSLRHRVESLIQDSAARRRFYQALVTSPEIERAQADGAGEAAAEALLAQHAASGGGAGVVWLIGAGPGSEDLLTLRAQRLLQDADVIVHDQLVPDVVVQMGRRDAEQISVGKAKGHHSFSQAQINTLLVRLASEGKRVARLKSGDPMVFGRAGEEIAALRKAGIGFIMATAHGAEDDELQHWALLATAGLTLALYMGKSIAAQVAARLIEHGASATLPVGIVVNAGRVNRSLYSGTLQALAADRLDFADGPAVILVGEAVAAGDWAEAAQIAAQGFKVA